MRRALAVFVVGGLAACGPGRPPIEAAAPPPDPGVPVAEPPARLPEPPAELGDDVTPRAYRVELELDPAASSYRGTIEIDVDVGRATRAIWLHAGPDLTLAATATRAGQPVALDGVVPASGDGIVGVALHDKLAPGPLTLRFEVSSPYRDRDGLFAQVSDGERFVYTDFEPVDARQAFPCFDLPRWRAPWTITVRAPDGIGAYSNMPEDSQTREGDVVVHRFAPTPPLPSYLVAIAVGRFTVVDVPDAPVPARVMVPGAAAKVALAASLIGPVLTATRATIDRPIPFPKIDFVVVPELSGAMENPGLITVSASLATPRTPDGKRLLALVIGHELAHLWFGDWVTVPSWRELWLNEGLATWLADRTLTTMAPPLRVPLETIADRLDVTVDDRVAGVHALRPRTIDRPRALFDRLSYDKGAALIHALDTWLGPERVRAALAAHLDRHAWGAAGSEELIASLGAIDAGLPIAAVITDALEVPGLATVRADVACAPDRATLSLRVDGPARTLLVCARWGGEAAGRACTVTGGAPIELGARCPTWVVPDDDGAGYYRWQLEARWWAALAPAPLALTERRTAIENAIDALAAGTLDGAGALAILAPAIATGDRRLLEPAARWTRVVLGLADQRARKPLARTVAAAAARALTRLGRAPVANDDPDRARARGLALELAALAGDRKAIAWADQTAAAWLRGATQADTVTGPALAIAAATRPRRRAQLLAAARRGQARTDEAAAALGRALAVVPDADLAELLGPGAAPPTPLQQALVAALLEQPDRAASALALLGDRAPLLALFATGAPCALPEPPSSANLPSRLVAPLAHQHARLAVLVAQCQAVAARLAR